MYSQGAEETDFNEFTDRRSLMNEVLRQVFTCTAIGLNLMESETNLDDLTGKRGVKQRPIRDYCRFIYIRWGQISWIVWNLLIRIGGNVVSWMRQFPVSIRKLTLSKILFVDDVISRGKSINEYHGI